jgi:hypothetical protein
VTDKDTRRGRLEGGEGRKKGGGRVLSWGLMLGSVVLVVMALVGMGWRLGARYERLTVQPFEDGAQVSWQSEGLIDGAVRVQASVCVTPEALEANALEGAALSLWMRAAPHQPVAQQHHIAWALDHSAPLLREKMACVGLPPEVITGEYALLLDTAHPDRLQGQPLRLEIIESEPLGWADWMWCWLLLGAMGLQLGAWSSAGAARPCTCAQRRCLWTRRANPASQPQPSVQLRDVCDAFLNCPLETRWERAAPRPRERCFASLFSPLSSE